MNPTPRRCSAHASRVVAAALLALLLAQFGALWHAWAHGPLHAARAADCVHAEPEAPSFFGAVHLGSHPYAKHLTAAAHDHADHAGHAAGSPVCQLLDQLLLGQAPEEPGPLAGIDLRANEAPNARPASATPSTAPPAYEARGPPRA